MDAGKAVKEGLFPTREEEGDDLLEFNDMTVVGDVEHEEPFLVEEAEEGGVLIRGEGDVTSAAPTGELTDSTIKKREDGVPSR